MEKTKRKVSKKRKFAVSGITVGILSMIFTVTAFAINYDSFPYSVLKHITKRTAVKDIIRWLSFNILSALGRLVNYFETAVDTIISFNIMDLFQEITGLTNMTPVAWMTFSIFLVLGACGLMLFPEKVKMNDFLKGILMSAALIIALPTFISSMNSMKRRALADIDRQEISQSTSASGYSYTLGDELLSQNVIDLDLCATDYSMHYYSESSARYPQSVFDININALLPNEPGGWDQAVVDVNAPETAQTKYDDLTYDNMAELLGIGSDYRFLKSSQERVPYGEENNDNGGYTITYTTSAGLVNGQPVYEERTTTVKGYEQKLIWDLAYRSEVVDCGQLYEVRDSPDIESAMNCIKSTVIKELNIIHNKRVTSNNAEYSSSFGYEHLMTQAEYDELAWHEKFTKSPENIYKYDFDFWFAFLFLAAVFLALFFSALKCGSLMFETIFVQIVAPVVIASDLHNSGRAKQVFKHLLSSYLMFIIVCMLLKIFIWSVLFIHNHVDNYVVQILLIVCFAKGVITGPDFITKVMGMDSGMSQSVGMLMQLTSMAYPASMALRTATGAAVGAKNLAFGAGGTAVGALSGGLGGLGKSAVKGTIAGYNNYKDSGDKSILSKNAGLVYGATHALVHAPGNILKGVAKGAMTGGQAGSQIGHLRPMQAVETVAGAFKGGSSGVKHSTPQGGAHSSETHSERENTASDNTGSNDKASDPSDNSASQQAVENGAKPDHISEPGDQGTVLTGPKGDKGDKGDPGIRGQKGEQGKNGETDKASAGENHSDIHQNRGNSPVGQHLNSYSPAPSNHSPIAPEYSNDNKDNKAIPPENHTEKRE